MNVRLLLGLALLLAAYQPVVCLGDVRPRGHIKGRVTDLESGKSVSFAPIMIRGSDLVALTDTSGRYVFEKVPPGKYTLLACPQGYAPDSVEGLLVAADSTTIQDFVLKQVPIIGGHESAGSGREHDRNVISPDSSTQTQPRLEIEDILQGTPGVVDRLPGSYLRRLEPGELLWGYDSVEDRKKAELERVWSAQEHTETGKLLGTVKDAKTGEPIAFALVSIHSTRMGTRVPVDGRYTVMHVPAGVYTIHAEATGYYPDTVSNVLITHSRPASVDFGLRPLPPQPFRIQEPFIPPGTFKVIKRDSFHKPVKDSTTADSAK